GEVQIGSSGNACGAGNAGALRYNGGTVYVCYSSAWTSVGGGAGGTLPALTNDYLWVGNGSNVATAVQLSSDVTITNAGVATVAKINGVTLGSTTATAANILIGSGAQWVTQALSQDVTITSTGVATVGKIQNVTVGSPTGTAGSAVVLATSPTIAAPTLTGTTAGANLTLSGTEALTPGSDYSTTGAQNNVSLGTVSTVRYTGGGIATFTGIVA